MRVGIAITFFALVSTAQAQTFTVSNTNDTGIGSLRQAITDANATTGATITFSPTIAGQTITLGSELPLILGNNTIINGGNENITINGANLYRVFFIGGAGQAGEPASTTATIENLTITGANAQGGAGGGTGGGGAGLGGAIFVSSTGSLTLSNVNLSSNAATGGNGGNGSSNSGGGGGMGGAGSVLGGGGGFGRGANGGNEGNGGAGAFTGGGSGGNSANGRLGGANGGGGGGAGALAQSGGGGVNGGNSGAGGFGGGGGTGFGPAGGAGGFGGGGAGTQAGGSVGGNGGFGGGGGGGFSGFAGGAGGFGGGNGGTVTPTTGGGGGGAGMGGAIFVQQGGNLVLSGTLTVNGNSVTKGLGGLSGGADGSAFGSGLFLQGNGTITFQPGSGQTQAVANVIADQTGSGGTGGNAGSWNVTVDGRGTLTLSAANTYSGGTAVAGGTLQLSGAGTLGAITGTTTVSGGTLDLGGTMQTQRAVSLNGGTIQNGSLNAPITSGGGVINGIGGSASLTTTAGLTTLFGTNAYTGATTVNGGVLDVEGAITGTSAVTVNAGGALMGAGVVDPLLVTIASGAALAPGNGTPGSSMTIAGNLALQSGAIYLVMLNPSTASFANVTGAATLGGATVNAAFANGSYVSKSYTILTASGGVSGTFGSLANTNLPANFKSSLSYDANDAFLNLTLNFAPSPSALNFGSGLNGNQQAVANALINFFNRNGSIPLVYGALNAAGLTQASGELGTSAQQTTFDAMNQFTGLLTDPFMARNGGPGSGGGALGFAEDTSAYAASKPSDALAMFTKAPPRSFERRWSVWAAGFGGSQSTDGNAGAGSNDTTSRIYGTAVGADFLFSPDTLAGFALAGGGTSFSVTGLGSGRSDLFQAGAYLRHTTGPAYISAALAYGWQDITTDRTMTAAGIDHLRAEFDANAWSGRLEGGYRIVAPLSGGIGLTPYAAAQFTTFDLPAYAEQVISGASTFALGYATRSVTDTRSELGLRSDKSFALTDGILTLRGRLAWAHDYDPNRAIAATFQALPGASFVVNGAAQAAEAALTTASAEMKWANGWSAAATFEGEFSSVTRSYAGKGVVRYAW